MIIKKSWEISGSCLSVKKVVEYESYCYTKNLEKRMKKIGVQRRIETVQTNARLRLARMLRRVLEGREDLLLLEILWKLPVIIWTKISQGV